MNSQKRISNNLPKKSEFNNLNSISHINHSNKAFVTNIKKSISIKNSKYNQTPINRLNNENNSHINNTNLSSNNKASFISNKYKTTKNSPNKLFKKDNPKNLKIFNSKKIGNKKISSNDSKKNNKLNSKISINNSSSNNKKIVLINKKINEKSLIGEIFKKKLIKKKNKKSITSKNSNNNSINLSNSSYKNIQINSSDIIIPRLKYNNINNGNRFKKIKEQLFQYLEESKEKNGNKDNINFSNFMTQSILLKNTNSHREKESLRRMNVISEKRLRDKKNIFYGQTSKDFYIIKKYISSVLSHQPQRRQKPNFSKKRKYNTITNKILSKFENEKNYISSNRRYNNNKKNYYKKNEYNYKNKINNKLINLGNTLLLRPNFRIKNISRTSYPSKQNSKKDLNEKNLKNESKISKVKTMYKNKNEGLGMPIRLTSENSKNNNIKGTNISTNNYSYQNSEIITKSNNKKVDIDYHFVYNNYIINNKKGFKYNNLKNQKKKSI